MSIDGVRATRLRTEDGHTVIEDFVLEGSSTGPSWISDHVAVDAVRVRAVSEPFEQSFHPAPRRHIGVILSGLLEVEVHSGDRRRFGPGSIVYLVDTTGSGHITRILEPAKYLEIHLGPEDG